MVQPASADTAAQLSRRGQELADARRVPLPAVRKVQLRSTAFSIGLPALDAFPYRIWSKLYASRWHRCAPELMRYGDAAGYRPLREAIASYIGTARGIRCTPDHVIVVTGSQQALEFCARILLDPGDRAWLEDPGYLGARAALVSAGARIIDVPVDEQGLDVAAAMAHEPGARLVVVTPSHQFPLGHTMSLQRRLALIDWAVNHQAWIVEDDYEAEFRYVGKPQAALKAIDSGDRVIYVGTFSKVLFPGLRLGYVIAPDVLVDAFVAAHLGTDMHPHSLDQAVVADFIEQGHLARHLRRMRVLYQQRQQMLIRLAEPLYDRLSLSASDGGLHLIGWLPRGCDDATVAQQALRQGVDVWPLSMHCHSGVSGPALLLGYAGTTAADMASGVEVLTQVLDGI